MNTKMKVLAQAVVMSAVVAGAAGCSNYSDNSNKNHAVADEYSQASQVSPYTGVVTEKVATTPYQYTGYKKQVVEAQIGSFKVPENRDNPNSKMIELKFVKFPSTSDTPKEPIVYLSGGPGGSATGTGKRSRFQLFMDLRSVADVIMFDQRGTGLSNSLKACNATEIDIAHPATHQEVISTTIADIKRCVTEWNDQGVDLNGYNTKQNAADLVDLTNALGVKKVDLWGLSYGSHLAFAAAKYHPQIINQMVLASIEGLDHTIKLPSRVQGLIVKVDAMVKADAQAAKKYPDMLGTIERVLNKVEANPVVVDTQDFRTKKPIKVGISKIDLQFALSFIFLRDADQVVKMPRMFKDMDNGKFEEMGAYIAFMKSFSTSHNPMGVAMDSASGVTKSRWDRIQKEAKTAFVGRTTNFPNPDIDPYVQVNDLGDDFRKDVISDIPTLFFAGTLDGRTLYESQIELTKNFNNGTVVTVDGAGHNLFVLDPEITTTIIDFLNGKPMNDKTIKLPKLVFQ